MNFVDEYLNILGLHKLETTDSKEFLKQIIKSHQLKIPFDSIRKMNDSRSKEQLMDNYNNPMKYLESFKKNGLGGVCYHLSWGLYNLLIELGYDVKIIKLEESHIALVINLNNKKYYADVSFWAPLFDIYPLEEYWNVPEPGYEIEWRFQDGKGYLYRGGEIAKSWNGEYLSIEQFWDSWEQSMNDKSVFLNRVFITKWLDTNTFAFLNDSIYKEFEGGVKVQEINLKETTEEKELAQIFSHKFGIDYYNVNKVVT